MGGLDRHGIQFSPLSSRVNRVSAESDIIDPDQKPSQVVLDRHGNQLERIADRIHDARRTGASVMMSFGAHTIKNGLGAVLIRLVENGYLTHLATNGAGIIHDWELSYLGATSEDVRANLSDGTFGLWEETGRYLNLALAVGAYRGLGYGQAVGTLILDEGLSVPDHAELLQAAERAMSAGQVTTGTAALTLLGILRENEIATGSLGLSHPWKHVSVQAAAVQCGVSFTGHPMFGHDIIYTHPVSSGAAIGICAERDFLTFASGVQNLTNGVYLSIGSAVMSPMVFEKSLSMARNIACGKLEEVKGFTVQVVDLNASHWNWDNGEPPETHPDYYLRFMKTFSRAGAEDLSYLALDNRDYLTGLLYFLQNRATAEDRRG